ncbi:DUF2470 domain-containing protein [Dactylosporangium sp. CA-092794]|uniref:DUF2470 domain-containing protein n=1 Tax=Dactylosporangium sp. CA-092794 TaxID=3239929 RepID=UPI003D92089D
MGPTRAEVARTLAYGRLPGKLQRAGSWDVVPVAHATDSAGRPLLLARTGSGADRDLSDLARRRSTVVLTVDDVPPLPNSPSLGRVRVAGHPVRLDPVEARAAALEFARANPAADLLDVGLGTTMYRAEVERAAIRDGHVWHDLEPSDYASASPDPLHEDEQDLLLDLAGHHAAEIGAYLTRRLAATGLQVRPAGTMPVRLDRYGFTIDTTTATVTARTPRWLRLDFPQPVRDRPELAHVLHGVLFHGDTHIDTGQ